MDKLVRGRGSGQIPPRHVTCLALDASYAYLLWLRLGNRITRTVSIAEETDQFLMSALERISMHIDGRVVGRHEEAPFACDSTRCEVPCTGTYSVMTVTQLYS